MNNISLVHRFNSATEKEIKDHLLECNACFSPHLSDKVDIGCYTRKLMNYAMRFEAFVDNLLVGLIAVYINDPSKKCAYITNVSTLPSYMGKGIANEIMQKCISYSVNDQFKMMELEVSDGNQSAIQLYKKFGFEYKSKTSATITMQLNLIKMNNKVK